uniref:Nipped-B protein n=1 Tax=Macrostomum lignano TaxID=282301 RepID=A0A1I8FN08_9PLAT
GYDWFEGLLRSLLKEEKERETPADSGAHRAADGQHPDEEELRSIEQEMVQLTMRKRHDVREPGHAQHYSLIRRASTCSTRPSTGSSRKHGHLAPSSSILGRSRQSCAACYTVVTLLLKYFDLESITTYETGAIMQRVFSSFMFFCSQCADPDGEEVPDGPWLHVRQATRHLLLQTGAEDLLLELIAGPMVSDETKTLEEASMVQSDSTWKEHVQQESLKEMHDVQSGKASMVAQAYLDHVPGRPSTTKTRESGWPLTMVVTILRQGLIHPVKTVGTSSACSRTPIPLFDPKPTPQLMEIEKHYPASSTLRALFGGCKRVLRPGRVRAPLAELLYVADNLASFPYQVAEEPLFLIHHLDLLVSVAGSTLLTSIKDYLGFAPGTELPDGCTPEMLATRIPAHTAPVEDYLLHSRGIALLLSLKQYLKELYGISDSKKPLNRRSIPGFRPQRCLDYLASESVRPTTVKLAADILDFEDLMLTIDPNDAGGASGDEEGGGGGGGRAAAGTSSAGLLSGDTVSAKQLPYHPAVQRGLDLKVQLTRIDSGMAGPAGLQSEAADERRCRCLSTMTERTAIASSQGPAPHQDAEAAEAPPSCQIWRRRPSQAQGLGVRRVRGQSVQR